MILKAECVKKAIECFLGGFSSHGEALPATRLSRRPEESALKMATAAGCCGNIIATLSPPHPYRQDWLQRRHTRAQATAQHGILRVLLCPLQGDWCLKSTLYHHNVAVPKYWIVNLQSAIIVNVTCVTALAVLSCKAHYVYTHRLRP